MRSIGRSWARSLGRGMGGDRGDPPPCFRGRDRYAGRPCLDAPAQRRSRGSVFTSYFTPIRDETGAVVANLATAFETTNAVKEKAERDQRMRSRRESEARLKAAVDLVKLGRYSWNPQTNELEWDEKCRAMWGLPADATVDYDTWRTAVHPDDLGAVEAAI